MRHPPYHLRPNKAIDRFLLVKLLDRLGKHVDLAKYTYYGFGGPFLEDFRIIGQRFPEMPLVSIERDKHTFRRQVFHHPSKNVRLVKADFGTFLATYTESERSVFWLDYTDLRFSQLDEFMQVLSRVGEESLVKITLRAESEDYLPKVPAGIPDGKALAIFEKGCVDVFRREFSSVLPVGVGPACFRPNTFPQLVQDMVQIAAQRALPAATELIFQVLSSCVYADKTQIVTVAGIVCTKAEQKAVRKRFSGLRFANLDWKEPKRIDVPVLSIKERLRLEKYLPCKAKMTPSLLKVLGYYIDEGRPETLRKLRQYADLHLYYPHFARVVI